MDTRLIAHIAHKASCGIVGHVVLHRDVVVLHRDVAVLHRMVRDVGVLYRNVAVLYGHVAVLHAQSHAHAHLLVRSKAQRHGGA